MGHGKETPRQKMIGMMYLVLTALLALNVSKDILEAFVLVEGGLSKTTENFSARNQTTYDQFAAMALSNPKKVGPWHDKAIKVKTQADDLFNYIQDLKIEIIQKAEGKENEAISEGKKIDQALISSKDNMDIPAEIMYGTENSGKGKDLKAKISDFRNYIVGIAEGHGEVIASISKLLDTSDPKAKEGESPSWESEHFEHLPLIAVTTILSKMQGDIRNAESEAINYLINQVEAGSFKFNKLESTVIPNSNYIIKGNEYSAEVFIAASDTTQRPSIYVGNVEEFAGPDGQIDYRMVGKYDSLSIDPKTNKGIYKRPSGTVGTMKWGGIIQLKTTDGFIKRRFKAEYQVAEANAVVSPTKMNVLYIGVDNPISISVSGIPSDRINATSTNGIIRRDGQGWIAIPRQPGNALILVDADIEGNGKRKNMGSMEFRVKNIPDPIGKVAGRKGGPIEKGVLLAQMVVNADLEGFEFDAKFTVTEFSVAANVRGFTQEEISKSFKITPAQRDIIGNLKKGDRVYFDNIKAVGPDGKPRELPTISFKIQ